MLARARARFAAVAVAIAALASSCALSPSPLAWRIEVTDTALADRIETVEARILRGGCGGVPVFRVVVRAGGAMGPVPPVLAPGVWGFEARANDPSCIRVAADCIDVTLPGAREAVNVLDDEGASSQACPAERCTMGECIEEDADSDGAAACGVGEPVGSCDCDDDDASVRPGAEDSCLDTIDQDCDGANDACDADCDGFPDSPGMGVDGLDCDDDDETVHPSGTPRDLWGLADGDRLARGCDAMPTPPAASDACTMGSTGEPTGDSIDQDCNGFVDDGPGCTDSGDRDRDGAIACGSTTVDCDTNDCDPGVAPSRVERCGNGIDEDGDPTTPDACDPGDTDRDGQRPVAMGGTDCDDSDPHSFLGAPDDCLTAAIDESCGAAPVTCSGDEDGDGYVGRATGRGDCNDRDPAVRPFADEDPCDGDDDDCDGIVDEVVRAPDATPGVPDGCVRAAGSAVPVDYDVTRASAEHCGGCGLTTASNEDCCAGVRTAVDAPESCGACGFACGEHTTCVESGTNEEGGIFECACAPDPSGVAMWADCNTTLSMDGGDGCETDVLTDAAHCGGCNQPCGVSQTCVDGTCTCVGAALDCDGTDVTGCEIDGDDDVMHCGDCAMSCSFANAGATCASGTCRMGTCAADFADCDMTDTTGCEASLTSIPSCGRCGETCAGVLHAGEVCVMRRCDYMGPCDATFGDCDGNRANGCEASLRTVTVCGTCATNCNTTVANAVGRTCSATGTCDYASCLAGFGDCDASRTNGCESSLTTPMRCGACGTVCGSGETCNAMGDCACGATVASTGEACPGAASCVGGICL